MASERVGRSDKTGKFINNALPELFNAQIGESLGLVLSKHAEAYCIRHWSKSRGKTAS
jgi:hypothetical protein